MASAMKQCWVQALERQMQPTLDASGLPKVDFSYLRTDPPVRLAIGAPRGLVATLRLGHSLCNGFSSGKRCLEGLNRALCVHYKDDKAMSVRTGFISELVQLANVRSLAKVRSCMQMQMDAAAALQLPLAPSPAPCLLIDQSLQQ
jgi:hypothetical protein